MADAWKSSMDVRYRVRKLKLVVEWEDGDVAVVLGEHLIADIKVTPPSVPELSIEVQDFPYVLLPMHNEKVTLEFTPQPPPSRLELSKGGPQHFDASTRWLHQSAPSEPTDAQVEAALVGYWAVVDWSGMTAEQLIENRARMRDALRAAHGVSG